jgi:hypothetical protein
MVRKILSKGHTKYKPKCNQTGTAWFLFKLKYNTSQRPVIHKLFQRWKKRNRCRYWRNVIPVSIWNWRIKLRCEKPNWIAQ